MRTYRWNIYSPKGILWSTCEMTCKSIDAVKRIRKNQCITFNEPMKLSRIKKVTAG